MATILLTGGAGFIGSHVVDALLKRGDTIVCVDNLNDYYDPKIKIKNVMHNFNNPNFHFYVLDLEHKDQIATLFKKFKIDKILHLAARAGVRPSIQNPLAYREANVSGTINLLELAKEFGIKNFVCASSSSVYGAANKIPFNEDDNTDRPLSPYAASKKACEIYCYNYSYLCDLSVTCLRYFTVYGPRNRPDMAIYKFADDIVNGKEITLYGTGDEIKRDWTFVADIVEGTLRALDFENKSKFEIINIGNNTPVPVTKLVALLEKELGKKAKMKRAPLPTGEVPITYADTNKIKKLLNWQPTTPIEEGVKHFVKWFKEHKGL